MAGYKKTEVYVSYVLYMNPIQGRAEDSVPVKRFASIQQAQAFYARELVDEYQTVETHDGRSKRLYKHFREHGPLEWFNSLQEGWEYGMRFGTGLKEEFSRFPWR
jgi:hypothetical protein